MKRNYKLLVLIGSVTIALFSFLPFNKEKSNTKDQVLIDILNFVLEQTHFKPIELDDDFSKDAFATYMENLDPIKRYFTEEDFNEFKKYENSIDDIVRNKDLTFFNLTYNKLMKRMQESKIIYTQILNKPFNLTVSENLNTDYSKSPYAKNETELEKNWAKQLKFAVVSTVYDKEKVEADKKLKDANYQPKTMATLEKEARESIKNNIDTNYSFMMETTREDWFSVFLNAIVVQYDPHTYYFSPENKEKFDTNMSGKFEGIGARLTKKNDAVEIAELISGGPAWRGKQLEAGDIILKVAQGNQEPVDIGGMRLDDAIKKIKGSKGTEVRLTVKKIDGTIKVISIIRDEVETEETFAKSTIVNKGGKIFGVINLPKFYISFENRNGRDAFKDVALEIERLKAQKVEGIVLDLRDNGGGSLETVVKMGGLFIEQGPIVQVKAPNKRPEILPDPDNQVQWDGPLVIMVNNYSASASEILAAAMQDYKRAIIIGSKQSYGKGTVQNIFDLNQTIPKKDNPYGDLGALKSTTQKYYRINGGSTQLEGVKSDIVLPDRYSYIETGEKDEKHAMAWDKIEPAKYNAVDSDYEFAILKSKKRISYNDQFKLIEENAKWLNNRKDDKVVSLSLEGYKKEIAEVEKQTKKFKSLENYRNGLVFNSLPNETEQFAKDNVLQQKRERWHEDLSKDVYVDEALNVLSDMSLNPIKSLVKASKKKNKKEITELQKKSEEDKQ